MRKTIIWLMIALVTLSLTAATIKVSDLTAASSVADADLTYLIQSTTSKKCTALVLKNYMWSGVTSSAAELNVLDGVAAGLTAAELSILDGVTATAAEINRLDGVAAGVTAAELSYVDGLTDNIQAQLDMAATKAEVALMPYYYSYDWAETGTSEEITEATILTYAGLDADDWVVLPGIIIQVYQLNTPEYFTDGDIRYDIRTDYGQTHLNKIKLASLSTASFQMTVIFRIDVKATGS